MMDRRSLPAGKAITPVAVTVPTQAARPIAEWLAALSKFEACRAEEEAYDREVWTPAYDINRRGGPQIPDHINVQFERLTVARCNALDALIAIPAPDLLAAIWKIEHAREHWADFSDWPDDWWDAVLKDLRRLAAGAN